MSQESPLTPDEIKALGELRKAWSNRQDMWHDIGEQEHLLDVQSRVRNGTFNEDGTTPLDESWAVPIDEEVRYAIAREILENPYRKFQELHARLLRCLNPSELTTYSGMGPNGWEVVQYLRPHDNVDSVMIHSLRSNCMVFLSSTGALVTYRGDAIAKINSETRTLSHKFVEAFVPMYFGSDEIQTSSSRTYQ